MPSPDDSPYLPQSWGQRHPRLLAGLVMLVAGTAVAIALSAIALAIPPAPSGVAPAPLLSRFFAGLTFFEIFAAVSTLWSVILFGSGTRCEGSGADRAIFTGVACVLLAILTFFAAIILFGLIEEPSKLDEALILTIVREIDGVFFLTVFVSLLTGFVPYIVGGVGGYMIWRMTRSTPT